MATSLVSTGVQFPDSTIQTTAATGSPNWAADGAVLFFATTTGSTTSIAYMTQNGQVWASTNILTTDPVQVLASPLELQLPNPSSTSGAADYLTSWTMRGLYSLEYTYLPRIVKDGFTGRYTVPANLNLTGNNTFSQGFTTNFSDWTPYRGTAPSGQCRNEAFNPYTGTKIQILVTTGSQSTNFYRYVAADAYNVNATPTTYQVSAITGYTYSAGCWNVTFVDTGSAGTSYFLLNSFDYGTTVVTLKGTSDGTSWSYATSTGAYPSKFVGSPAETMFYSYAYGITRSLDNGATWSRYAFGNSAYGVSNSYFPSSVAWNGTYWLCVWETDSFSLNSKIIGSSTTWARLTNISTPGVTQWASVVYNPTLGVWLALALSGAIYSNSSANPNAGTWTYVRQGPVSAGGTLWRMYVPAASTWNF